MIALRPRHHSPSWFSDGVPLPNGFIEIAGTRCMSPFLGPGRFASFRPIFWTLLRMWGFITAAMAETLEDDHRK